MAGAGGVTLAFRWLEDVASPLFFTLILAWMMYTVMHTVFTFNNSEMTITRKAEEKGEGEGEDEEVEEEEWNQVEMHEAEDDKPSSLGNDNAFAAHGDTSDDDIVEVPPVTPLISKGNLDPSQGEAPVAPVPLKDALNDALSDALPTVVEASAISPLSTSASANPVTTTVTAATDTSAEASAASAPPASTASAASVPPPSSAPSASSTPSAAPALSAPRDADGVSGGDGESDDDWEGIEASEAEDRFSAAAALVTTMAATGNLRIGEGLQLLLYGLYKQASDGPCDTKQPAVYSFKARAKWDAWKKLGSMSQDEAMAQYVGLVEQIIPNPNEGSKGGASGMAAADSSGSGFGRLHALASADVEDTAAVEEWVKQHPEALEQRDDEGRTALHWAADRGKLAMTRCLLAQGADVNQTDDEGQTPLHYATDPRPPTPPILSPRTSLIPPPRQPTGWQRCRWRGVIPVSLLPPSPFPFPLSLPPSPFPFPLPPFPSPFPFPLSLPSPPRPLFPPPSSPGHPPCTSADGLAALQMARGELEPCPDGLAALQMAWGELEPTWAVGSDCSKALGLSCDDQGRIVAVNMPAGNISGYLPEGISALKSLQQISLPSNQLFNSLPLSVSLLTNLTSIELSNNNITGSIPPTWFQLRDLEILDLSRNRLTSSLPDAFDSLAPLQLLNLSSNSFTGSLPPSIGNLNFLEKLDLHSNPFSGTLPAALAQLSSLTLLDISATGLLCPHFFPLPHLPLPQGPAFQSFLGDSPSRSSSALLAHTPRHISHWSPLPAGRHLPFYCPPVFPLLRILLLLLPLLQ
ncbi:unnamed protein product [Closterium sp. NIES-64]|nr:unnamed protein product [Closterium sp. NIES-64]